MLARLPVAVQSVLKAMRRLPFPQSLTTSSACASASATGWAVLLAHYGMGSPTLAAAAGWMGPCAGNDLLCDLREDAKMLRLFFQAVHESGDPSFNHRFTEIEQDAGVVPAEAELGE